MIHIYEVNFFIVKNPKFLFFFWSIETVHWEVYNRREKRGGIEHSPKLLTKICPRNELKNNLEVPYPYCLWWCGPVWSERWKISPHVVFSLATKNGWRIFQIDRYENLQWISMSYEVWTFVVLWFVIQWVIGKTLINEFDGGKYDFN